uniref:FAM186A/B N-terminal domain-containing protein n=1 Tax=Ornithorhynchus anatinus TaxID=9258 RepID=K7EBV1_ORNAN
MEREKPSHLPPPTQPGRTSETLPAAAGTGSAGLQSIKTGCLWHRVGPSPTARGMEGEVMHIKTRVSNMISRFQEETGFDLSIPETPEGKTKLKLCKTHFLEKLNFFTTSARKKERLLEDIFTWINSWGFVFSEELPRKDRHVQKDEWADIIAQMLPLVLITKDGGVRSLVTLCSHLIGEKKCSQKRASRCQMGLGGPQRAQGLASALAGQGPDTGAWGCASSRAPGPLRKRARSPPHRRRKKSSPGLFRSGWAGILPLGRREQLGPGEDADSPGAGGGWGGPGSFSLTSSAHPGTKGMLWKQWRERGPAMKPPTTREMLHDPTAVASSVQEIRAMLTELLGSSWFNKSEMDIIRHMNEMVENLGEALAIQKQENKTLKCQRDYLHAQLEGLTRQGAPKVTEVSKLIPRLPRRVFPVPLARRSTGEARPLHAGVVNIELAPDAVGAWKKPRAGARPVGEVPLPGLGPADLEPGPKGQPGARKQPKKLGAGFRLLGLHSRRRVPLEGEEGTLRGEVPEAQLQEANPREYKARLDERQPEALEESNLGPTEVLASTSSVTSGRRGRQRGPSDGPRITIRNSHFIPSVIRGSILEDDPPNSPESPPPDQSDTG